MKVFNRLSKSSLRLLISIGLVGLILLLQFSLDRIEPTAADGPPIYLPLITKSPTNNPPPATGGQVAAFWLPYTSVIGDLLPTYGVNVAVDSTGGIHVSYAIFTGLDNSQRPAYYTYCPTNCATQANWTRIRLSNFVQDVRLALDAAGHPRIMLYTSNNPNLADNDHEYQYAVCDGGCTNSANWTITVVTAVNEIPGQRSHQNNRYFALDPWGRPAFVFTTGTGTAYAYCEQACTDAANWFALALINDQWSRKAALAFTPTGDPRIVMDYFDANNIRTRLVYLGCETLACANLQGRFLITNTANGSPASIGGEANFGLRIDHNGQTRVALYTGSVVTPPLQLTSLHYLGCNTDCLNPNADPWSLINLGIPAYQGAGVDLALDPANRPRLAYELGGEGLGFAWCNTNCETTASNWQRKTVESTSAIVAQYPRFPPYSCPIQTWFNGKRPSLTLDQQGNPRVGYDAEHWWGGYFSDGSRCEVDVPLARFAMFTQP